MAITRWNDPFRGLSTVHRELDDIFSNFLNQSASPTADNLPTMDVYTEDDKRLVAEVHLPGFSPEDVEIRVQDNVLEIRGERREEIEDEDRKRRSYVVRQSVESFFRRIVLPNNADQDNVQAEFKDGVLRLVVPFVAQPEARRVAVNMGDTGRAAAGRRGGRKNGSNGSRGA
jgi:HSP20 family protein